jgi:2-oxoglutarate dehydrogenase complex dehydrogenase (E1) component-like enzyme
MGKIIQQTSFLNGTNATFVAKIYAKYLENPDNVDPS